MHPNAAWGLRAVRAVGAVTFVGTVAFFWLVGVSWLAAYVCWVFGCSAPFIERVASPVRFLLRNPPSAGLATLLLASLALLLFFHPIHDFVHNLESFMGARRTRRGRRTKRVG
jgi:hypothetical protein